MLIGRSIAILYFLARKITAEGAEERYRRLTVYFPSGYTGNDPLRQWQRGRVPVTFGTKLCTHQTLRILIPRTLRSRLPTALRHVPDRSPWRVQRRSRFSPQQPHQTQHLARDALAILQAATGNMESDRVVPVSGYG